MGISTVTGFGNPVPAPAASNAAGSAPVAEPKAQAQPQQAVPAPTAQQVQDAVKEVVRVVQPKASNLQFSIDQSTGRTIVKVVDDATGDLIRQIPSEELVQIAKDIDRMQSLLMKQKA